MRAVLAACCLFAVCLLFARGDEEFTETTDDGDAPPPPSGDCVDNHPTTSVCVPWKEAGYCKDNTDAQTNCAMTCETCQTGKLTPVIR
uniref:ShKL7 n=1 Tax=Colubraria reticulata TaxID=604273 RepID=A0A481SMI6_9CAEN|nr:ShKL7 [Colubraria reticulata]